MFERSDVVVLGTIQSISDGPVTKTYLVKASNLSEQQPSVLVTVAVDANLKGKPGASFTFVVPQGKGADSMFPTSSQNHRFVFFIQQADRLGSFTVGQKSNPYVLLAPGCSYKLKADTDPILIAADTKVNKALPPMVQLADVVASQMDAKGLSAVNHKSTRFFRYLEELTPERTSDEKPLAAADANAYRHWLTTTLAHKLDLSNEQVAMNFSSLAISWGFRGTNEQAFMRLYKAANGKGMYSNLPPLHIAESMELFPYMPSEVATGAALGFRTFKERKGRILQLVLPRLGESEGLDRSILESLSNLYDKPELNPYVKNDTYQSVPEKVQRAKALFGNIRP